MKNNPSQLAWEYNSSSSHLDQQNEASNVSYAKNLSSSMKNNPSQLTWEHNSSSSHLEQQNNVSKMKYLMLVMTKF
jgi:hypothetical protein